MSDFGSILSAAYALMDMDFSIYGFTFSFWDVFLWSAIAGIIIIVVRRILDG